MRWHASLGIGERRALYVAALSEELTRSNGKFERQVDVCSANGTGVRRTGRAEVIASASKNKGLRR